MKGLEQYLNAIRELNSIQDHPEIALKLIIDKSKGMTAINTATKRLRWILEAKPFYVDADTTKLLTLTQNKIQFKPLPFNNIFIDTEIDLGRIKILGIHLQAVNPTGTGTTFKICEDQGEKYTNYSYFYLVKDKQHPKHIYWEHGVIFSTDKLEKTFKEDLEKRVDVQGISFDEAMNASKSARIFVMNFLDLLNNPEVEIATRHTDPDRNQKRRQAGKIPLPPRRIITLKGKIKQYIDQMKTGKHFTYGHQFWVRGHFRTYTSDKYKAMNGKKQWILPFIKGQGILIEKTRMVEQ